jgi:hypothetical protein
MHGPRLVVVEVYVFIYFYRGKAREFRRDETKRKYKIERQTFSQSCRQIFNKSTQYETKIIGKYACNDL